MPLRRPLIVYLEHHTSELHTLDVKAKRPDEQVGKKQDVLTRENIEQAAGKSIAEMLEQVDGVEVLRTGPSISKPVIHGLSGDRVMIVDRGVRQEDQQWGSDHAPNLDPLTSGRIMVVKGAASVEYGAGALGGVIISEALPLHNLDSVSGKIIVGAHSNGRGGYAKGLVQGPIGRSNRVTWRIAGGGRLSGDRSAPDYNLVNTGDRGYTASAEMGWKRKLNEYSITYRLSAAETGVLRSAHIGNLTDLEQTLESGEPRFTGPFSYVIDAPRQQVQHHVISATGKVWLNETDRLETTIGFQLNQRLEFDRRRSGRTAKPSLDMELTTTTVKSEYKHFLSDRVHGKVGISGMFQENINVEGTGVRPLIPYYTLNGGGFYVIEHCDIGRSELEFGARVDRRELSVARYDENNILRQPDYQFLNGSFSAGWEKELAGTLKVNVASGFRNPNVSELYSQGLHHGSGAIEEGNEDLGTERSIKLITSYTDRRDGRSFHWSVTAYADRIWDFIQLQPAGTRLTIQGAFPVQEYKAFDALLVGSDIAMIYRLTENLTVRNSSSIVLGRDFDNNEYMYRIPAPRTSTGAIWKFRALGIPLESSLNWKYVSMQNRFPEDLDLIDPPSAYHLVDLDFAWTSARSRLAFAITNIFNERYRDLLDQFRYYSDSIGRDFTVHYQYNFK
jgi:iron complex outermembrane receptor protein